MSVRMMVDFASCTRPLSETIRLIPSSGLSLLKDGLRVSIVNTEPACKKLMASAATKTPPSRGARTIVKVVNPSTRRRSRVWPSQGWVRAKLNAISMKLRRLSLMTFPAFNSTKTATPYIKAPERSLLCMTCPFFRASRSFLGVGCSVLSSPIALCASQHQDHLVNIPEHQLELTSENGCDVVE